MSGVLRGVSPYYDCRYSSSFFVPDATGVVLVLMKEMRSDDMRVIFRWVAL